MPISRIDNEGLTGPIGGRRNLIINGAMQAAQRGTSVTSTSSSFYQMDRFRVQDAGNHSLTSSQESDAPEGFANSIKVKVASTFTTGATTLLAIGQIFEGQDLQLLKKGTSNALPVTVSFYVKSNLTGNIVVELLDRDSAFRHIEALVNISSANTWEYKTVTFAGDTSGVLDNDNDKSLDLQIYFSAGSNFTSGTLATSWATYSAANRCVGLDLGSNNFGSSTDNFISITGVQLEVGSVATEFEHRSFGEELALCQRYFRVSKANSAFDYILGGGTFESTTALQIAYDFTGMRAAPTVTASGGLAGETAGGGVTLNSVGLAGNSLIRVNFTASAATTVGLSTHIRDSGSANAVVNFSSEL
jgi:hypothetical protein